MKLTKTVFALTAVMLLTGCGGKRGKQTGRKATFAEFEAAVNALPSADSHPYTDYDATYEAFNGANEYKEESHCVYGYGGWVNDEGYIQHYMYFTAQEFLVNAKADDYEHDPQFKEVAFYVSPLSYKCVFEVDQGVKYDVTMVVIWNDPYGLPTYNEQSATVQGQNLYKKHSVTYYTKKQTSGQTSQGGGEGQAVTKVEKEQFLEASANLPVTHPYIGVTMKRHSEAPGEAATDKTTHFTWNGSEWVADDGYSYFQGETISYFMSTSVDAITQSGYTITRLDYYIQPFAVILEAYMEISGYKIEAYTKAEWNEYGLMTYAETVGKSAGYTALERAEFTYETTPNN